MKRERVLMKLSPKIKIKLNTQLTKATDLGSLNVVERNL